ncbi:MAG: hypothetical protein Q6352_014615 [Candidatus Freyrarchaeum guaymaensis]
MESLSWAQYFWIRADGAMYQSAHPGGGVTPIWDSLQVNTLNAVCLWFESSYCADTWVWLGEWAP